ncbi:MAG: nicotinate-nucleotide diphosphorylase (carboxylating) [Candidatus Handelsmanbacteria bacterium RIFCSPLOWO2_12_FULL_64_10]|uniref:Probable nicotinate-nucleotide pyrophosphorylase [carboxylating] n=1 Tax=Handelsmanbacteria sp. (strain RIFCSPLOWO2_12_FULL_64_10) TaxID=1817868 RepID=A0A1F6C724_HANXR|nr:MAG: nicotinate-nucleotide diphosphorylase (carboxylating) [Candidatus Handelsmanbacteria bacterium RIFCSPLOWO2_12_FULL_64_10]
MQPTVAARDLAPLAVPQAELRRVVAVALEEDLGYGDVTTDNLVPATTQARAAVVFRSPGVVCGLDVLEEVFRQLDGAMVVERYFPEGAHVASGTIVARVRGAARAILKGERVALNFVQRMAATATATAEFVTAIAGLPVHVIDTRKTTPGLRHLDKYAIRVGGGRNHRFNLSDGVLVKDNHLAALRNAGIGTVEALRMLRDRVPHTQRIEVEIDRLDQIPDMLEAGVDTILLDNMTPAQAREAVQLIAGRAATEVSGGVRLETVRAYAEAGVDVVSAGALTHSTPALDVAIDFELE